MTETTLVVQGLTKSYGSTRALEALDFSVGRGEVFALLGITVLNHLSVQDDFANLTSVLSKLTNNLSVLKLNNLLLCASGTINIGSHPTKTIYYMSGSPNKCVVMSVVFSSK